MNRNIEALFQRLPTTAEGYAALQDELKRRIQHDRPRVAERIKDATADDPNLLENAEYQAAKSEQEVNETRIAELQDKLARAEVIDVSKLSGDTILKPDNSLPLVWQDTWIAAILRMPSAIAWLAERIVTFSATRRASRRKGGIVSEIIMRSTKLLATKAFRLTITIAAGLQWP